MENEQNKLVFLAEDISISQESKLNPIFLSIDVKLCDSALNKNKEGVTEEFIADVVSRANDHTCLPFYADVKNLLAENYDKLGHMFNRVTKQFGTSMVGSISDFYSQKDSNGVTSLYGIIKVPKRDRDIVYRLVDLYEMGHFAVSVELKYDPRELKKVEGGSLIDVSENSALTGLCLVWKPACEDAYALDMVAEESEDSDEIDTQIEEQETDRGETGTMEKENVMAEEVEQTAETENTVAEAEAAVAESTEQAAETNAEETVATENANAEDAGEPKKPEEEDDEEDKKEDAVAETQETQAEVLSHSIDTHESVENWGGGEPVHVVEVTERIVETLEQANEMIAEQKKTITELETQIAELTQIKEKYDAIVAEEQARVLAEKQAQTRAFAEKQGLDVNAVAVAEAIEKLDYEKIMELTMAEEQAEEKKESEKPTIALASFVEIEVSDDNQYGGLLNRRNK